MLPPSVPWGRSDLAQASEADKDPKASPIVAALAVANVAANAAALVVVSVVANAVVLVAVNAAALVVANAAANAVVLVAAAVIVGLDAADLAVAAR